MDWTASSTFEWTSTISNFKAKQKAAQVLAARIESGQIIGIGSGSTAYLAIQEIARRMKSERLSFLGIPTSLEVRLVCARVGIACTSLIEHRPDWAFDGADEVDNDGNMIKGRGGAFYTEKLVAGAARKLFILVDRSKLVTRLGAKFPIPVEVHPPAIRWVEQQICDLGASEVNVRAAAGKDGPLITEHGNIVLDVRFPEITPDLEKELKSRCGIIESGLFWGYKPEIIIAD
ncbi:MAG TPA: ribose 5-phosphate isomerase A [Acidobacteriota bacterium]|jgi:ribose 5-phosphate isomerase A|nr:ribose 5-phosphate isomerase A [Acidobacteriota bacterium]